MIISYSKNFNKSFKKVDKKIQKKFDEKVEIFFHNPNNPILNNHPLNWEFSWFRSINISWDYRAIFREYPNWTYEFVEFIDIWTHSQLY